LGPIISTGLDGMIGSEFGGMVADTVYENKNKK